MPVKKVLIVKTTSLGDLIHTMPGITDISQHLADVECHWLVEESFKAIPLWHPFIKKVHTCAIRRWRQNFFSSQARSEIKQLKQMLQAERYDLVIDAQGLIKSALMIRWLKTRKVGYDSSSIKEPLASWFYTEKQSISRQWTAIERVRALFASACGYTIDTKGPVQFGLQIKQPHDIVLTPKSPYAIFLHGTNWHSKVWPANFWSQLADKFAEMGVQSYVSFGSDEEKRRAEDIANDSSAVVLPPLDLTQLAYLLQQAKVVVGSDTGLSHISAALGTPTVGVYGSTNSLLTGLIGDRVVSLQATTDCSPCMKRECPLVNTDEPMPCYQTLTPDTVLDAANKLLEPSDEY